MSIFFYEGKEYFIPGHLIRKHCFETEDNDYGITTCYYYKKKKRNIYGTTTEKERKDLREEGIELTTIPWIENKEN